MFNEDAARDAKILEWRAAQAALALAKEQEAALRAEVVALAFADHKDEGTENVELGNGWKLKAVFKIGYTLDNKDDAVDKALSKIEKAGGEGEFIAGRLVKWKPELSVSEYKKLPDKFRKIIDAVLTTKPGTPSLELIEPKKNI